MVDFLLSFARWAIGSWLAFMLLTFIVGEMIGHAEMRRALFWIRGRSEEDGSPTRRFPLP